MGSAAVSRRTLIEIVTGLLAVQLMVMLFVSVAGFVLIEASLMITGLAFSVTRTGGRLSIRVRQRSRVRWALYVIQITLWLAVIVFGFYSAPNSLMSYLS